MDCRICLGNAVFWDTAKVIGRYDASYYRCVECGYIQPYAPNWLDEAYSDAITSSDIGLIGRNMYDAQLTVSIIRAAFKSDGRFLDYGGGYGVFVRLMRDAGYDYYRYDTFCENMFARGFDLADAPEGRFELVTAFEVFEHLVDPMAEVGKMLSFSDSILFSTLLVPEPAPRPGDWWYYGLEHGQHVSLYTRAALEALARRMSLHLCTNGTNLHLLTRRAVSPRLFNIASNSLVAAVVSRLRRRRSLLESDYAKVTGQIIR